MSKGYNSYRGRTPLWKKLLVVVLILVILAAGTFLFLQKYLVYDDSGQMRLELPWSHEEPPSDSVDPSEDEPDDADLIIQEPETPVVRGILLPGGSVGWQTAVDGLKAAGETAFAVTVKEPGGRLHYLSQAAGASAADDAAEADGVLRQLLNGGTYAIARISCFRDGLRANADMEGMGLKNTGGYIFYDGNNENWLDPGKEAARRYLCDIAAECAAMGFDEILLTDFTYPTVGKLNKIDYGAAEQTANLQAFLQEMAKVLPENVKLSVELPARLITEGADMAAGLNLAEITEQVDAVYAVTTETGAAALAEQLSAVSEDVLFIPELAAAPAGGILKSWLVLS